MVTLKNDVPVKETINDFILKPFDKEKIFSFLDEMEFTKIKKRIEQTYGMSETNFKPSSAVVKKSLKNEAGFNIVYDKKEIETILAKADDQGFFAVDTETNSLDSQKAELVGVSLAVNENQAYYVPVGHKNKDDKEIKKQIKIEDLIKILKPYLEDETIKKVGQNIKYDLKIFKKYGIHLKSFEDTMLLSYALDSGLNRHNLDILAKIHLDHENIKYKDVAGTGKSEVTFDQVKIIDSYRYACEDADVTLKLYNIFKERLVKEKCFHVYENLEIPLVDVLARMECQGIKIDKKILSQLSETFAKNLKVLEKKIYKIAGEEFNIGSTKQLGDILYEKLKISGTKKQKKVILQLMLMS